MNLSLHLSLHLAASLLAGFIVWRIWQRPLVSFVSAIIGGFFIDFDHFIDHFIAFGFQFNVNYFLDGHYGPKNEKFFYLFHGWEYIGLFLLLALFIKKNTKIKSIFLALALGIFSHLLIDVTINEGMTVKGYSIIYKIENDFRIEKIVTPEDYQKYLIRKQEINFSKN